MQMPFNQGRNGGEKREASTTGLKIAVASIVWIRTRIECKFPQAMFIDKRFVFCSHCKDAITVYYSQFCGLCDAQNSRMKICNVAVSSHRVPF